MKNVLNRTVRLWIYSVAVASVPVIVALGWADPQTLALSLPLVLALLNLTPKDVQSHDTE